ncbi:MAG: hypothetical protein ACPG6P_08455 [Akkermansiaceae bacterium]
MKKYLILSIVFALGIITGYISSNTSEEKGEGSKEQGLVNAARGSRNHDLKKSSDTAATDKFSLALGKDISSFSAKMDYFEEAADFLRDGMSPMGFDCALYNNLKLAAASMSEAEMKQAIGSMRSLEISASAKSWLRSILFEEFARRNGGSAMAYIVAHQNDPAIVKQKMLALRAWINSDPKKANRWLQENPEKLSQREKAVVRSDHLVKLAKSDFPSVLQELKQLHAIDRNQLIGRLRYTLSHDPEKRKEFLSYLGTLKDPNQLIQTGLVFMRSIAERDPQEGIKFFNQWQGGSKYQIQNALAESWARTDPEAAMQWLTDQPLLMEKDLSVIFPKKYLQSFKENTQGKIFAEWVYYDEQNAVDWVNQQKGLNTDPLYRATSENVARAGELAEAFEWANKINDESVRYKKYGELINRWVLSDVPSLKKWLAEQPKDFQQRVTKGTLADQFVDPK